MVEALNLEMKRLVDLDIPMVRKVISIPDARKIFTKMGDMDKVDTLKYRLEKTTPIYECLDYVNYMYGRMVPSTGYLKKWNLTLYTPGLLIQYPRAETNGEIPPFEDAPTFGRTLKEAHRWGATTNADSVAGINKTVDKYGDIDFINMCEARHNQMLCELGASIEEDKENIRLICIAGPSSSGKTTFSNRLRIELMSRGINPIRISIDDYYLPRSMAPKDENGEDDLESIDALDVTLFNQNMAELIAGGEVELPRFDFKEGVRKVGRKLQVPLDQPIIIEGIHALNDLLTNLIPRHQKFKIYIAPQPQIKYDNHNPISLTDLRLLRRIVRDHAYRNASAEETIGMWPSVRKGEFKWIYNTQEGADFVFNSFLSYELCVMRKHALPLLQAIAKDSPFFAVAERLIRMLKYFVDIPDEWIPCNSLIREFIGGSCYADAD
jgi:uridine kinase